jgi:formylmethanofuran dehydrogenase subunit E
MSRILLLIILLWILYVVIKRFMAKTRSNKTSEKGGTRTEKIVACSQCGLHIPESESLVVNGMVYCNNPACNKQDQDDH